MLSSLVICLSDKTGSYNRSNLFLRILHTDFKKASTNLHSHRQWEPKEAFFFPAQLYQNLFSVALSASDIQTKE